MFKQLKVRFKLLSLVAVSLVGLLVFSVISLVIINKLKINGTMYQEIIQQKDLVADILPPPEYIIELHLTSYELLNETDANKKKELLDYAKTLEDSYNERHAVWQKELVDGQIKTVFLENSYKPVQEYFTIFNGDYKKAIEAGDSQKAADILNGQLEPRYEEHRQAIDQVVELANEQSSAIEAKANTMIKNAIMLFGVVLFAIVVCISLFCLMIIRGITSPLNFLREHLKKITNGDLRPEIPVKWLESKDELGSIARTTQKMQEFLKGMMASISAEANRVNQAVSTCNANMLEISAKMSEVSESVNDLSAGIEETAASTQEITSVSEQIGNVMENIADQAVQGNESAGEISRKANELKEKSVGLKIEADDTTSALETKMNVALEQIKEVEQIKVLSGAVLSIAGKTNLLALNASIEAARAGEAGKGFAVVAEEIGKLAQESKAAVSQIQSSVESIVMAVQNLTQISKGTLEYIETRVKDSFSETVQVGENYENDATYIKEFTGDIKVKSEQLFASMQSVISSINEIAKANNEGSAETYNAAQKLADIKENTANVLGETQALQKSTSMLQNLVLQFQM